MSNLWLWEDDIAVRYGFGGWYVINDAYDETLAGPFTDEGEARDRSDQIIEDHYERVASDAADDGRDFTPPYEP